MSVYVSFSSLHSIARDGDAGDDGGGGDPDDAAGWAWKGQLYRVLFLWE